MSERFPDEVLQRAWQARIERETEVRDRLGLDSAAESAEANAAGLAAMRAVLEGHLAAELDEADRKYRDAVYERVAVERQWQTWGIVEIAIRNVNVKSYMDEWEGRALRAEAALRDIGELMADAEVPGGTPLPRGVIWLRDRAERAEAKVADAQRHHAVCPQAWSCQCPEGWPQGAASDGSPR